MCGSEPRPPRRGLSALPLILVVVAGCIGPHAMTSDLDGRQCAAVVGPQAAVVSWYGPEDGRDRATLDAWCAAVGPVVVDTEPERPAVIRDSLRVFVWNVNAGGGDLVEFIEREAGSACAAAGAPAAPFVVLIQEAYRRSPAVPVPPKGAIISAPAAEGRRTTSRIDVTEVARRCGLALMYVPAVRNGDEEFPDGRDDRGNALLANVALHDPIAVELPSEDSRRLAIAATVRGASGDSLRLVSLHFTLLPRLWRNLMTGDAARVRHALGLVDALRRLEAKRGAGTPGGIATLAAGDANTWSADDAALRRLREAFPDSPAPLGEGTRGPFPADHLFFRRAAAGDSAGGIVAGSYRRVAADYGSDHNALAAVYRYPR